MITVFLADDHRMFRQGLRTLLDATGDIRVVGEAGDGQEALRRIEKVQPDVAVLDLAMPSLTGIEGARQLVRSGSRTKVLILTMHGDCYFATEALKAGALGFLFKEESVDHLAAAIRAVARGEISLSAGLENTVLREFIDQAKLSESSSRSLLTERERQVLQMVAEGITNQEIAEKLCISPSTVDTHRKNIMAKLDIHTVAGLVKYAIRHKIVMV